MIVSSINIVHKEGIHKTRNVKSKLKMRQNEVFELETKDGVTVCTPGNPKLLTPYVLLEQGNWYENELDFIRDYLKESMNVVDVGAGFGVYSLLAARWVGDKGTVYAFEPGA